MRLPRIPSRISIALLLAGLGACASSGGASTSTSAAGGPLYGGHHGHGAGPMHGHLGDAAMQASCPMDVPGVHVRSEEVEGGVALTFTTEAGDVVDLRRRVHLMAERHQQPVDGKAMHHGAMPPATVSVEETPDGARLVLKPEDPAQLDALRRHAEMHAVHAERGECPMMACAAHGR